MEFEEKVEEKEETRNTKQGGSKRGVEVMKKEGGGGEESRKVENAVKSENWGVICDQSTNQVAASPIIHERRLAPR